MKTCFKCKAEKPLSEFYEHSRMADGHLGKCKQCTRKDVAKRIHVVSQNPSWVRAERARCREKQNRYREAGLASQPSQEARKAWRESNPEKVAAQQKAQAAVRSGRIKRRDRCEACGSTRKLEKHHPDYCRPLNVVWLCTKCHGITRRKDQEQIEIIP